MIIQSICFLSIICGVTIGVLPSLVMFVIFQTKTKNKSKEQTVKIFYLLEITKILLLIILLSLSFAFLDINKKQFIWSFLVTHFILFISYWLLLLKKL